MLGNTLKLPPGIPQPVPSPPCSRHTENGEVVAETPKSTLWGDGLTPTVFCQPAVGPEWPTSGQGKVQKRHLLETHGNDISGNSIQFNCSQPLCQRHVRGTLQCPDKGGGGGGAERDLLPLLWLGSPGGATQDAGQASRAPTRPCPPAAIAPHGKISTSD